MRTLGLLQKMVSVRQNSVYQVKHRTGDWGITAENMEKAQHTDFNKDNTNKSAVATSGVTSIFWPPCKNCLLYTSDAADE